MFWLDCGRQYSNLSTFTRLTVDSISCLEFHTCEQVDQTSATWRLLSLEAPKIRSATRVGAFQECEMCPRQASCVHQSLGSPKTCSKVFKVVTNLVSREQSCASMTTFLCQTIKLKKGKPIDVNFSTLKCSCIINIMKNWKDLLKLTNRYRVPLVIGISDNPME